MKKRKRKQTVRNRVPPRLRVTAIHEAGHAVIGRVQTLHCGHATIRPNYREAVAGYAVTHGPWACLLEWEKRGHVRGHPDAVHHARIMTLMAGAEAERVLLRRNAIGDGDDRKQIALMAEELHHDIYWDRLEPRLRARTQTLVKRHRACIERVAKALLAKTTMSAKALDKMVGRSVDDVRMNLPSLKAMHARQ